MNFDMYCISCHFLPVSNRTCQNPDTVGGVLLSIGPNSLHMAHVFVAPSLSHPHETPLQAKFTCLTLQFHWWSRTEHEGCSIGQPIDIGINKPIKTWVHEKWDDSMMDSERIADGVVKDPSCKMVAEWLVYPYTTMTESIGRNSWMKNGFEWF